MKNSNDGYTIPTEKRLSPEWYKSLFERGKEEVYSGKELAYIGLNEKKEGLQKLAGQKCKASR